jgi:Predicted nucleic acid-binding protein, contains PIN domain
MRGNSAGEEETRVLDSWILLAWLKRQPPGSEIMRDLWRKAYAGHIRLVLHCMNLGEVFYLTAKLKNLDAAEMLLQRLQGMPVDVMSVSDSMVLAAARLKAQYRISYADAFAVVTAIQIGAELVTGDPEIQDLASLGIVKLLWAGR